MVRKRMVNTFNNIKITFDRLILNISLGGKEFHIKQ